MIKWLFREFIMPKPFPAIAFDGEASTADCKQLLEALPDSDYPNGNTAGAWKRASKRGTGALIERIFTHPSGLAVLVAQTPGRLAIVAVEPDIFSAEAQSSIPTANSATASPTPKRKPAKLEAVPDPKHLAIAKTFFRALAAGSERAEEGYGDFMQKAGQTPDGSPLRVAIGAQFEFALPEIESEGLFTITSIAEAPQSDQPHFLEELFGYDVIESPNESCDHWIHLEPTEAIALLLRNGFRYRATPAANVDPVYWPPMKALLDKQELDATLPDGANARKNSTL
jgi:hypothetical protein